MGRWKTQTERTAMFADEMIRRQRDAAFDANKALEARVAELLDQNNRLSARVAELEKAQVTDAP